MGLPNIALIGYAGSGKDTAAAHLISRYSYARVAFADPLKEMALQVDPAIPMASGIDPYSYDYRNLSEIVEVEGWEVAKRSYHEVRRFLQNLGATMREDDPDYWLSRGLRKIDGARKLNVPTVVTDVRYVNEYCALLDRGFVTVRIARPEVGPANEHTSELELSHTPTRFDCANDGTPADLADWFDRLLAPSIA